MAGRWNSSPRTELDPKFLSVEHVKLIHELVLADTPDEPRWIHSLGRLESALAQPRQTFDGKFLHPTLPQMAAAYCFHIVRGHPFMAGNKRVAAIAPLVFLQWNGIEVHIDQLSWYEQIQAVIAREVDKEGLTKYLQDRCHSIKTP